MKILEYVVVSFSKQSKVEDFEKSLVQGVVDCFPLLQATIMKHAPDWPIFRIAAIDRVILYLGIYELLFTDTPLAVVINEAVELAKEYGNENSGKFVNGVLSAVSKERDDSRSKS
jgi:N utilization substance protein B